MIKLFTNIALLIVLAFLGFGLFKIEFGPLVERGNWPMPSAAQEELSVGKFLSFKSYTRNGYRFISNEGRSFTFHCEPYPAIDDCLNGYPVSLLHAQASIYHVPDNYKQSMKSDALMTRVVAGGKLLFSDADTKFRIDKTYVSASKTGSSERLTREFHADDYFFIAIAALITLAALWRTFFKPKLPPTRA